MNQEEQDSHSFKLVEHGYMWVFRRRRRILLDEFVDILDGPSTGEHPDDKPHEQDGGGDYPASVATESPSALRAGTMWRVIFILHDLAIARLCDEKDGTWNRLSWTVKISRVHGDSVA